MARLQYRRKRHEEYSVLQAMISCAVAGGKNNTRTPKNPRIQEQLWEAMPVFFSAAVRSYLK